MLRIARLCVRWLVVVMAALSLAGCGAGMAGDRLAGSSTTPPAQPTPSPAWGHFTSDRHEYSIGLPADWRVVEHTGSTRIDGMRIGSSGTDTIGPRDTIRYGGDDGVIVVSTHELEGAESLADFTARFSRSAACEGAGLHVDDVELDGEPAEERYFECREWSWTQTTAIHAGRGYVVWLVATQAPPPDERPINDEVLATFRFTHTLKGRPG
jgi:hypothetical protein